MFFSDFNETNISGLMKNKKAIDFLSIAFNLRINSKKCFLPLGL